MTKIKLVNGTIINATDIQIVNGVLKISTTEMTVEELAALFSDKTNTSLIVLMTESGIEAGFKTGFTSFAGITYDAEGVKTVELFQPKDVTEARISAVEGMANAANNQSSTAVNTAMNLENSILETQMGLAELAELLAGSMMNDEAVEEPVVEPVEPEVEVPEEVPTEEITPETPEVPVEPVVPEIPEVPTEGGLV